MESDCRRICTRPAQFVLDISLNLALNEFVLKIRSPTHRGSIPELMQNAEFYCAFCGEPNSTFVDVSAGNQQSYVEDCQVCCRPNILYVRIDEETLDMEIDTEYEG